MFYIADTFSGLLISFPEKEFQLKRGLLQKEQSLLQGEQNLSFLS